jgi:hypothetical protein
MCWKLWDDTKDGEPPKYAIHICGNEWMVLQQEVTVYRKESEKYFAGEYTEWQDVPLHIESKT